jgi:hypothetical protein
MKKIIFFFALFTILFSVNFVFAQTSITFPNVSNYNFAYWPNIDYILTILGIPGDYLGNSISNLIFRLIIPFIAIWTITLGLLKALRIFPNSPNLEIIIAFTMAFATLPTGIFVAFVGFLLAFSGVWSVGIFFIMFIGGSFLYFWQWPGWTSGWQIKRIEKEITKLDDEYQKYTNQLAKAVNDKDYVEQGRILRLMDDVKNKRDRLYGNIRAREAQKEQRYLR